MAFCVDHTADAECSRTGVTFESACRTFFTDVGIFLQATNFEEGAAGTKEDEANDDDALMQFEFYEILVRLAFSKFILSREMVDASDAVDRLMAQHVLPNLPAEALFDPNEFRCLAQKWGHTVHHSCAVHTSRGALLLCHSYRAV